MAGPREEGVGRPEDVVHVDVGGEGGEERQRVDGGAEAGGAGGRGLAPPGRACPMVWGR